MPTHEFMAALKTRKDELASELEAINKVLSFYDGEASPPPAKRTVVKRTNDTTVTKPESSSHLRPNRMSDTDRASAIGMLRLGKSAQELVEHFSGQYAISTFYGLKHQLKHKGEL